MAQIRTFIAIEIPSPIKEKLAKIQAELKKEQANIRWVNPNNIHNTLKFLGNIDESKIDNVAQAVFDATRQIKPFTIKIFGIGVFPNFRKPKVIWIGAQSEENFLNLLAQRIDEEIYKLGFEKETRPFSPHLTIGRVKSNQGIAGVIKKLTENQDFNGGSFIADKIVIMRSDLKTTGAIYTPLRRVNF